MFGLSYYWHKVLKRPYSLSRRIDEGRGQPVVFLHGIASTGENWREVASKLDRRKYRVIVFDLLGFGDSPRPDWLEYSVEDHAASVLASLNRMNLRKPVILVGHSMGSLVAAHIAEQHPRRVKHLILYQMPIYAELAHARAKDLQRQAYLSVFGYLLEHPKLTLWYAKILRTFFMRVTGFVLDERTWQPFEMSLKNTIMQQKAFNNLHRLKMPTDVVYGRYDIFVMRRNLRLYFLPSKYLRFYEVKDLHRVSARSSEVIYELIIQPPKRERSLSIKHAKLVDMDKTAGLEHKPQQRQSPKKTYAVICAIAAVLSVILSAVAWGGRLLEWERQVYVFFNNWDAPGWIEIIARISSDIVWVAVGLVALSLLIKKYTWAAYRIAVPSVVTYGVVFITSFIVGRARPEILLPTETVQRASQDGMGFPSGHVATIVAILLVLWPYLTRPMHWLAVLLIILVAWSRMFLGVHFPLDLLGSITFAIAVFCGLRLLPLAFRKKFRLDA